MAYNPQALIRYRVIDRCLRDRRRRWTRAALAAVCGDALREVNGSGVPDPSLRTIAGDLDRMRYDEQLGYHAPIEWDASAGTYRYSDPEYSISRLPLRRNDLHELERALAVLRQFQGFDRVAGIDDIVARLAHALQVSRPATRPIVQLDYNDRLAGLHWLADLYQAVEQEQVLLLTYHSFREPAPVRRLLSPYLLKEYNSRWFLIGYEHRERQLYTLALDRIRAVEPYLLADFYRDPSFDPQRRYRAAVGVTVPENGRVETVVIAATPLRAKYLRTKPLHSSQEEQPPGPDGRIRFRYRVLLNYELQSQLLAFADEVEVEHPETLRTTIRERVKRMRARYG